MRGRVERQAAVFVVFDAEQRVPADHPLRKIKRWADELLREMSRDFDKGYGTTGQPGIAPEQLLKALLLRALHSIPSEIKLMEAIEHNLPYRWFLDLPLDEPAWTPEVFSMNRDRFARGDLVRKFFDRVVADAIDPQLVSPDHFTVDGTLIRSLPSHKSLRPIAPTDKTDGGDARDDRSSSCSSASSAKGRDVSVDWRGERRGNAIHRSATDPEARLARKGRGREAHLAPSGHVLMNNRSGLCLAITVDRADGVAERRNALRMLEHLQRRHRLMPRTLGLDAGSKAGEFLAQLEMMAITPHVPIPPNEPIQGRGPAAAARRRARRRMKTVGYRISQRVRKRCEQIIGWCKQVGHLARTRLMGQERIESDAMITGAASNLLGMTRLVPG